MPIAPLDEICPGQVLAKDLIGPNGRFLLPKGAQLDEKQLRIMRIWGVVEADVEQRREFEASCSDDEKVEAQANRYVAEFMGDQGDGPLTTELRRLCVSRVYDRIARGEPPHPLGDVPQPDDLAQEAEALPARAEDMAGEEVKLASFPDIYYQIVEALNNPRSSALLTADVVGKDASLSAKLLRLVNSPFYGFPSKIDSITRAVTLIGSNELAMLALGVSVVQYFQDVPRELMDMKRFWKHSVACGVCAQVLATKKPGLSEERLFVAGLIHDIGRLVILRRTPRTAALILSRARARKENIFLTEREILGYDHGAIAGRLLQRWSFPESLVLAVELHHAPTEARNPLDATIVHVADLLAHVMDVGRYYCRMPLADVRAWESLGLSEGLLRQCLGQAERLVNEIVEVFLSEEER